MPRWSFRLPEALRIAGAGYPVSLGAEHDALAGGFLWNSEEHACIACLVNIDSWNAPIENGWLALDEKRLGSVQSAICHTRDGQRDCMVQNGKILSPTLAGTGGCIVLVRAEKGKGEARRAGSS